MKKILAITAMAAFAAVSFAEGITFSAWLRALAAPVANDGKDSITQAGNSWGGAPRSARLDVTAVAPDSNAGFNMGMYNDWNKGLLTYDDEKKEEKKGAWWIGPSDEANLWVKPIDMVKLSYGKYDNGTLMGGVCYGSWNWMRPNNAWIAGDEDLFMSKNGDTGLMAEITPMEGLYIQALVPITKDSAKAGQTYKNLRGGFAYTVPGLAKIKGQYIGKGKAKVDGEWEYNNKTYTTRAAAVEAAKAADKDENDVKETVKPVEANSNCTLEAEVDVLAVEGLFAGVGFQYNVIKDADTVTHKDEINNQMKVALGVSYQVMPELKVSASGAFFTYYNTYVTKNDYGINGLALNKDYKLDPRFQAGVGVDYDLGDGLAANADFRYLSPKKVDGEKLDNTDKIAFSVGVKKSVSSNGSIGVAFQGITNSGNLGPIAGVPDVDNTTGKKEYKNFVWAIPVAIEVSF